MIEVTANEKNLPVIELPCNFGDTLWGLENYCNDCPYDFDGCHRGCTKPAYRLKQFVVDHFKVSKNGIEICSFSPIDMSGKLGEDVFFTKEEAMIALEKANKQNS